MRLRIITGDEDEIWWDDIIKYCQVSSIFIVCQSCWIWQRAEQIGSKSGFFCGTDSMCRIKSKHSQMRKHNHGLYKYKTSIWTMSTGFGSGCPLVSCLQASQVIGNKKQDIGRGWKWALPDLHSECQSSVGTARSEGDLIGQCGTSTANARCRIECRMECQIMPDIISGYLIHAY